MFTAEELEAKSEEGKRQNPIAWLLGRGIGLLFLVCGVLCVCFGRRCCICW